MPEHSGEISSSAFGCLSGGEAVTVYELANRFLAVRIADYGGRIVSVTAPDRAGERGEVVLGFDAAAAYEAASGPFGALLGRSANRIADGKLPIDGETYRLSTNDRGSTLHGGARGFDKVMWRVEAATDVPTPTVTLSHVSPDGDQGFPGEMRVRATYRLDGDTLWLSFEAETTRPTVASLSAHPYFNLAGVERGDVLDHLVTIAADTFLPTDERQIPTGEIRRVAGTKFDFRRPERIGARIRAADAQLINGRGYDHCFVLDRAARHTPRLAARAVDPASGRALEILTTQPGLQFYTGNNLNGGIAGRGGILYRQSAAFAFEPQGFPDAPHHPNFESTILRPGETYRAIIGYRFTAEPA
jgi:aldose 1-epimerase